MMISQVTTIYVETQIGKIAVHQKEGVSDKTPVMFLHGVYFDHHLWDYHVDQIKDRAVISVDMPLHGASREISKPTWTLNDCAEMLLEILNCLHLSKVIAVGHSWGSMTILRAASRYPDRFESVLLSNMPFKAATKKQKVLFKLQHRMLVFRNFYTRQVAKALFSKASLKENPRLPDKLQRPMRLLSNKQIRLIEKKVILDAEDVSGLLLNIKVRAIAVKGVEDYVPTPPNIETFTINGGHISPLEAPEATAQFIKELFI